MIDAADGKRVRGGWKPADAGCTNNDKSIQNRIKTSEQGRSVSIIIIGSFSSSGMYDVQKDMYYSDDRRDERMKVRVIKINPESNKKG
jgi:hypothetical protein